MSNAQFDIAALRCACESGEAVMCIDPGSDTELDEVFATIVLRRGVAARGWCAGCFAGFAALLPHEAPKRARAHV